MPRGNKEQAEQIIPKLLEAEVEVGRGNTVAEGVPPGSLHHPSHAAL